MKKLEPRHVVVPLLLVLTVTAAMLSLHLFRAEEVDNPALGVLEYRYRWGVLSSLACDADRNGIPDARLRIESISNAPATEFTVLEGWESSNLDGLFDIHYWFEDGVLHLGVDSDRDGDYDQVLSGEAAETRLAELGARFWDRLDG